jgi:hypothetical protein
MLLDLTLSNSCCYVPHHHLPTDVSRSQAQAIGGANVMVIIFPGPLDLVSARNRSSKYLLIIFTKPQPKFLSRLYYKRITMNK